MAFRVLVADGDEELNGVLQQHLASLGYVAEPVWDGDRARECLLACPPDLLLLDVRLPGTDGWELCRLIHSSLDLKELPVVIHTAGGSRSDFDQARRYNVAGFFIKPYMTLDVIRHVDRILQRRLGQSGSAERVPPAP